MFIKSVKLTKSHWSYKLLYWTFPSLPKFYNFCPYFWLTILSLFISPIKLLCIGVGKGYEMLIENPIQNLLDIIEKRGMENKDKKARELVKRLTKSDIDLIVTLEYYDSWMEVKRKVDKCVLKETIRNHRILVASRYGKELIRERYRKTEYYRDLEKNYRDFIATNKKTVVEDSFNHAPIKERPWYPTAIKYTKFSLWTLIIPLIYLLYKFLYWLFFFLGWVWYWICVGVVNIPWISVLIGLGIVIIFIVVGMLGVWAISKGIGKLRDSDLFVDFMCRFFQRMWKIIKTPFKLIGSVIMFFWNAMILFKKDNCPPIIWEDE